jgi:hypothetical protein
MIKELEKVREIFLSEEIDEELRADNEERIKEWEQSLIQSEAFASWQDHDITKNIVSQIKSSYKEIGVQLSTDRKLTETQRQSLWAKQDACTFLLELTEKDAKGTIEKITNEIRQAINAT